MKHILKSTATLLLLLPLYATSFAEEPQKVAEPMQPGMDTHQGMGMGMMGGMSAEQKDQHLRAMQEHMLMMHDLSNQILAEKDPAKKEQLKNQQLQLMKTHHEQRKTHRQQIKEQRQQMREQRQQMKQQSQSIKPEQK
ncbi:MAG: hypothetical protein PHD43_01850 [Methylococcales bacterium]|nr:hypothetical protein [Methylococcales bacterium]